MLNLILGWNPTNFFSETTEGLPQAATEGAPTVDQAEPGLVQRQHSDTQQVQRYR